MYCYQPLPRIVGALLWNFESLRQSRHFFKAKHVTIFCLWIISVGIHLSIVSSHSLEPLLFLVFLKGVSLARQ